VLLLYIIIYIILYIEGGRVRKEIKGETEQPELYRFVRKELWHLIGNFKGQVNKNFYNISF